MPAWPAPDGQRKLSAAWLVETAGLKGFREGEAGVSDRHALVLVNHGSATGAQVWALAEKIIAAVQARFGMRLEPEPRIV
jgi:UDP-N-acetylmuramate dehydrogenase